MRTATATAIGRADRDDNGNERWPGIVSRFQLVLLAERRSKQLLHGARPRIPADPLKRRNTSMALEELRRGLLPFRGKNGDESNNATIVEQAPDFDLPKAEYVNERSWGLYRSKKSLYLVRSLLLQACGWPILSVAIRRPPRPRLGSRMHASELPVMELVSAPCKEVA